jgi:hypothetical protein
MEVLQQPPSPPPPPRRGPPSAKEEYSKRKQRSKLMEISEVDAINLDRMTNGDIFKENLIGHIKQTGRYFMDLNDPRLIPYLQRNLNPDNQLFIDFVGRHPQLLEVIRPPTDVYRQVLPNVLRGDEAFDIASFIGGSYKNPFGKRRGGKLYK